MTLTEHKIEALAQRAAVAAGFDTLLATVEAQRTACLTAHDRNIEVIDAQITAHLAFVGKEA